MTDTYEQQTAPEPVIEDALSEFREQARQELEERSQRSKLSDVALAKLRAIREQDKAQEIIDARFAAALRYVIVSPENLTKLIERCNVSPAATQVVRRTAKLNWWVTAGYRLGEEIDSVTMINFFSELIGDEKTMSEARFLNLWNPAAAAKLYKSRQERGLIVVPEEKVERLCGLRSKCIRAVRRQGHPVIGKVENCSAACRGRARALAVKAAIQS